MMQDNPPLRFDPSYETIPPDEEEIQQGLTDAMLSIARKTHDDLGQAYRAVHAKAHGYLKARFEVLPDLPLALAQGLFAQAGSYDAILRFSTTPGDILNDNVSSPRGVAIKVLGVPGCAAARMKTPRTTCSATRPRSRSRPLPGSSSS